jgi:predicted Zn finger-like uncharacterized protein
MSLATRCTHCGTIFKVVQDQLKVSEGWVRCGRCHEVFNALEGLFDLEREAPPARVPQVPEASPPPQAPPAHPAPHTPSAAMAEPAAATVDAPALPPSPVWSEPPTPEPPAPGVTQFDLDLPGHDRLVQPATPVGKAHEAHRAQQSPAAEPLPSEVAPAGLVYPETEEADALESRYLLPREDGAPARKRRRGGPDFADAEFPEHLVDHDPWADSQPASDTPSGASTGVNPPADAPDTPPVTWPAAQVPPPGDADAFTDNAVAPTAGPEPGTPAAPREPVRAAMPSAPAPLDEGFEPESALPPPSQRKGRSGTRGRAPQPESPEFIRVAERKALWSHPTVVGLMAGLSLMLGATLALQAAHHWRDTLAARQPAFQPALQAMCSVLHCQIQAPMQLDDLQVDSVQLVRTASEGPDTYRLTAIVHNKADIALRWPQLDLTLTDPNGAVLVRRMFSVADARVVPLDAPAPKRGEPGERPQDLPVPATVPPGAQTTVQWQIKAPNLRLAGYTAELFYP